MRVEITTRFDIEVGDRHDVELVDQWLHEQIAQDGIVYVITGIASVYRYPDYPNAGNAITIDNQWELVEEGFYDVVHQSSETIANHPDAMALLVATGAGPDDPATGESYDPTCDHSNGGIS